MKVGEIQDSLPDQLPTRDVLLFGFPDRNEVGLGIGRDSIRIAKKATRELVA